MSGNLLVVLLLLVAATPILAQSPADSVRLFKAPEIPRPTLKLREHQPFTMNFQPEGFFSPAMEVYGPSDQVPALFAPFAPPGEAYAGVAGSFQGGWRTLAGISMPYGDIHLDIHAGAGVETEKETTFHGQQGSLVVGNSQTGLMSRSSDWFWVGNAGWSNREIKPGKSGLSPNQSEWTEAQVSVFSDPRSAGDRIHLMLGLSQISTKGNFQVPGQIRGLAEWKKDLTIGWWNSTADLVVDHPRGKTGSVFSVLTGPEWRGEQTNLGLSGGVVWNKDREAGWISRAEAGWHGRQWHTTLFWQSQSVSDPSRLIHQSRWWYLPGPDSTGSSLIRNQIRFTAEWITGPRSLLRLSGTGSERPQVFVSDQLTLQVLPLKSYSGTLEWLYQFSGQIRITPGLTLLAPIGSVRSVPWEGMRQLLLAGTWLSADGETRVGLSARYHTARATDTRNRKKTGDLTEISLKTNDLRLKPLNLFAEFRIIIAEDEKSVPGLSLEPFQITAGFRYQF